MAHRCRSSKECPYRRFQRNPARHGWSCPQFRSTFSGRKSGQPGPRCSDLIQRTPWVSACPRRCVDEHDYSSSSKVEYADRVSVSLVTSRRYTKRKKLKPEYTAHTAATRRSSTPGIRIHRPQGDVRNADTSVRRSSLPHSEQGALGTPRPRKSYPQPPQTKVGRFTRQMRSQARPLVARTAATIPNNAISTVMSCLDCTVERSEPMK